MHWTYGCAVKPDNIGFPLSHSIMHGIDITLTHILHSFLPGKTIVEQGQFEFILLGEQYYVYVLV